MNKKIPSKEPKDAEVKKLKRRIGRLEKEIIRLKSELRTYEIAFQKTEKFLKDTTEEVSLEDLIEAANKQFTLKQTKSYLNARKACRKCLSPDLKEIATRFGKIQLCSNCGNREVINDSDSDDSSNS